MSCEFQQRSAAGLFVDIDMMYRLRLQLWP